METIVECVKGIFKKLSGFLEAGCKVYGFLFPWNSITLTLLPSLSPVIRFVF